MVGEEVAPSIIACITGMHRSGTSLIASWLQECGVAIHDGDIWGPSAANIRGHFEDKDFVSLHSSAIHAYDPASHGWKVHSGRFLAFDSDHLRRAEELIRVRNGKYRVWGWKDPRSVLFLEQWKHLIPELQVLMLWRPCAQVVRSLTRRSRSMNQKHLKVGLLESVRLWQHHNTKVCEYKQRFPQDTLLLPLDCVLRTDRRVFELMQERLDLDLRYSPLANLYDPELLSRKRGPLLIRVFSSLCGADRLEGRLLKLSDAATLGDRR